MERDSENIFKKTISEQQEASKVFGQQDGFGSVNTGQFSSSSSNSGNIFRQSAPVSLFGQVANVTPSANPINFTAVEKECEKSEVCSAKDLFENVSQPSSTIFTDTLVEKNILGNTIATMGHSSHLLEASFPVYNTSASTFSYQGAANTFQFSKATDHLKSLEGVVTETPTFSFASTSESSEVFTGLAFTNPLFKASNVVDPKIADSDFGQSELSKIYTRKARPSPKVFGTNIDNCEPYGSFNSPLAPAEVFSSYSSNSANLTKSKSDNFFVEKSVSSSTFGTEIKTGDMKPIPLLSVGSDNPASSFSASHFQSSYQKSNLISESSVAPDLDSRSQTLTSNSKKTSMFVTDGVSSITSFTASEGEMTKPSFPTSTSILKSNLSTGEAKQMENVKASSIFGGNGQSSENKNMPINIFGRSTAPTTALFPEKQALFTRRPISSSIEKGSLHRNSPSNDSEIALEQHRTEKTFDEDIFGLTNFEEPKYFVEKKSKPTSLIAVNVDENYLHKSILKTHFSKYGAVNKILINKKSNQASVFFGDHDSAAEAKAKGKSLHPKIPEMKLFYGAVTDDHKKSTPSISNKEGASRLKRTPQGESLLGRRSIINYGDIEQTPFDKPFAPIPKTKSSNKSVVKRASTRQPVLIKSSILQKSGSAHTFSKSEFSKPFEVPKPTTNLPSKVFGSEKNKSEAKPIKSIQTEDSSKKNDMRSKAPSTNIASIKDNSILLRQQSHNNYDKYLILDARDKCIRLKQEKILDVNKAHYLLATCPDMCPEKERYSRDIQYDLSIYELTDGKLDHKRSVKKFSRSSADKDEPLPHELRSGHVLKITMDYLACNIIDNEKQITSLDVWYNYLCNRTRALRNDIMTQHLVDDNAVYVLEKITRFHIHCSHHLCEEPADLFDSKMNAEHLTKSLQSLKELYHDMSENNVFYDSEAEFRAYEILIDAKDGNVIFKYLNFRDSVRNSSYVQFAVKVLNAIQSNNFVKFFKLLTKATYLQACIMHRHFLSIRCKALNVIAKAYGLPKESQAIPVARVMSMLGFSNENNFESFIKYFRLSIEDSKIIISKNCFPLAYEQLPPLKKSVELVAFKKRTSAGIIVQGGNLPQNPYEFYNPHDSFDTVGFLKSNAIDASDQIDILSFAGLPRLEENKITLLEPNQVDIHRNNEDIKRELIEKVKFMHKINLKKKFFSVWKQYCRQQKERKLSAKRALIRKIADHWKKFVVTNSELNRRADIYVMAKCFRKLKQNTLVAKETKSIKQKVKYLNERILIRWVVNKWKNLVNEKKQQKSIQFLRKCVISRKFFINWRLKTILSKLERRIDLYYKSKLLKICLTKWKAWLAMKKGQRKVDFESFPACGSQLPLEIQNELWSWGYNREKSTNLSVFQIYNLDKEISNLSNKYLSLQKLSGLIAWSTLPLIQKFQAYIDSQFVKDPLHNFNPPFKIAITIDPSTDSYFVEWIRTKFNFNETDKFDGHLRSKMTLISHLDGSEYPLIVEENDKDTDQIKASLRIFACNKTNIATCKHVASSQSDVASLILCCSFNDDSSDFESDTWFLNKEAIDNPATSEKLFYIIYESWKFCVVNTEVKKSILHTLIDSFITKKVIGPVFHAAGRVIQHRQPFLSPSVVVACYNDGLAHIIKYFKRSRIIIGVPSENWNDEIIDNICCVLQSAFLPNFEVHDWPFCDDVMGYLSTYLEDVTNNSDWCGNLVTEVKKIIKVSFERCNTVESDEQDQMNVKAIQIPWLDVVCCCIFYKISYIPSNIIVYYDLHYLEKFKIDHWISDLKSSESLNFQKFEVLKKNEQKRKAPLTPHSSQPKLKQKKISSRLLEELHKEKAAYLKFEQKFGELNEIDNELEILHTKYFCK